MEDGVEAIVVLREGGELETPLPGVAACAPGDADGEGVEGGEAGDAGGEVLEALGRDRTTDAGRGRAGAYLVGARGEELKGEEAGLAGDLVRELHGAVDRAARHVAGPHRTRVRLSSLPHGRPDVLSRRRRLLLCAPKTHKDRPPRRPVRRENQSHHQVRNPRCTRAKPSPLPGLCMTPLITHTRPPSASISSARPCISRTARFGYSCGTPPARYRRPLSPLLSIHQRSRSRNGFVR
jgi:hypothetical protein